MYLCMYNNIYNKYEMYKHINTQPHEYLRKNVQSSKNRYRYSRLHNYTSTYTVKRTTGNMIKCTTSLLCTMYEYNVRTQAHKYI